VAQVFNLCIRYSRGGLGRPPRYATDKKEEIPEGKIPVGMATLRCLQGSHDRLRLQFQKRGRQHRGRGTLHNSFMATPQKTYGVAMPLNT